MSGGEILQMLTSYVFSQSAWASLGLLVLRLVWGFVMFNYSVPMMRRPLTWMNDSPLPPTPAPLQATAAVTMAGGSLAIMAGLLSQFAALGLAGVMAAALWTHLRAGHSLLRPTPVAPVEFYETSLVYLAIAVALIFIGPGTISLDAVLIASIRGN